MIRIDGVPHRPPPLWPLLFTDVILISVRASVRCDIMWWHWHLAARSVVFYGLQSGVHGLAVDHAAFLQRDAASPTFLVHQGCHPVENCSDQGLTWKMIQRSQAWSVNMFGEYPGWCKSLWVGISTRGMSILRMDAGSSFAGLPVAAHPPFASAFYGSGMAASTRDEKWRPWTNARSIKQQDFFKRQRKGC